MPPPERVGGNKSDQISRITVFRTRCPRHKVQGSLSVRNSIPVITHLTAQKVPRPHHREETLAQLAEAMSCGVKAECPKEPRQTLGACGKRTPQR